MGCLKVVADVLYLCIQAPKLWRICEAHVCARCALLLVKRRGAFPRESWERLTGPAAPQVRRRGLRSGSAAGPLPSRPGTPAPAPASGPERDAPSTAAGRAPSAPPTREVLPLPAAKMAPAASPVPIGGGPGRVPECGRGGRCGEARPPPPTAAARRCPAATRRGPGRL